MILDEKQKFIRPTEKDSARDSTMVSGFDRTTAYPRFSTQGKDLFGDIRENTTKR